MENSKVGKISLDRMSGLPGIGCAGFLIELRSRINFSSRKGRLSARKEVEVLVDESIGQMGFCNGGS